MHKNESREKESLKFEELQVFHCQYWFKCSESSASSDLKFKKRLNAASLELLICLMTQDIYHLHNSKRFNSLEFLKVA